MTGTKRQESVDKLVKTMRDWQGIERHAIETIAVAPVVWTVFHKKDAWGQFL